MNRSTPWLRLLAALLAFGLVAAACGGDSDDGDSGDTDSAEADGVEAGGDDDGGDEGGDGGEDLGAQGPEEDVVEGGDGPVYGGTLRYGLEAETNTGYDIATSNCAISCIMVMRSIMEPLLAENQDGEVVPFLAQDFFPVPAEELAEGQVPFGVWDFVLRDGITFHDGSPLDAEAAVKSMLHIKNGPVSGGTFAFLHSAEAIDAMTMRVFMAPPGGEPGTFPWASFPTFLTDRAGYVHAPSMIDDPEGPLNPVGTGPFVFDSWTPNETLTVVRNDNYWHSDADGNAFPYLDAIEWVMLPDKQARDQALLAGDIDIQHTSFPDSIVAFREEESIDIIEADDFGETTYIMINHDDAVMADLRVRQALAHCLDRDLVNELRNEGIARVADGLFSPLQLGFLEDPGLPQFDPDAGMALWDEYVAENGVPELTFGTTTVPFNLGTAELITAQWDQNCGIEAGISQIEQGAFITEALVGNFQMFLWRNHAGTDPDQQFLWWWSETAAPLGEVALNFGRFRVPEIDEALFGIRTQADPAIRQAAAEGINQIMAAQVLNIPTSFTIWGLPHDPSVQQLTGFPLPEGDEMFGIIAGRHAVAQIYLAEG
ncbi:MAG: ABC transporter substrate-binding protein [Actinomycetota bacterium]